MTKLAKKYIKQARGDLKKAWALQRKAGGSKGSRKQNNRTKVKHMGKKTHPMIKTANALTGIAELVLGAKGIYEHYQLHRVTGGNSIGQAASKTFFGYDPSGTNTLQDVSRRAMESYALPLGMDTARQMAFSPQGAWKTGIGLKLSSRIRV